MNNLKNKMREQKKVTLKCKRSFQVLFVSLVILVLIGCNSTKTIYVPQTTPLPTIPKELTERCPDILQIKGSTPEEISKWIISELDQHAKCIYKSELAVKYLDELVKMNKEVESITSDK